MFPKVKDDTLFVTTHYNPCGYDRAKETYYEWEPTLPQYVRDRLVCYECVLDQDLPEIDGSHTIYGTRELNGLFQKEALINKALEDAHPNVKYFAWLDHDLVFQSTEDWYEEAKMLIERNRCAVQLFDMVEYEQPDRTIYDHVPSIQISGEGAPGGMWMADRGFLSLCGGLPNYSITGAGDQIFYTGVAGINAPRVMEYCRNYFGQPNFYSARCLKSIAKIRYTQRLKWLPCEYIRGTVRHLYHGSRKNRKHEERFKMLVNYDFSPDDHLIVNRDGLIEWSAGAYKHMKKDVAEYFSTRDEDAQGSYEKA